MQISLTKISLPIAMRSQGVIFIGTFMFSGRPPISDELHLFDAEWVERHFRKRECLRKAANFRYQASFEELDFTLSVPDGFFLLQEVMILDL